MPVNQKTGKNKGFAFITAPELVHIELMKKQQIYKKQQIIVKSTIRNTQFHKRNKIFVVGHSHVSRTGKERFKKYVDGANVYFTCFSGADTTQLDYYVLPTLAEESPDSVEIHIGSNSITKSNYNNVNVEDLAKKVINIGVQCKAYNITILLIL